MATMRKIEFIADVFAGGRVQFAAGTQVDHSPEAARWVARGVAREIRVEKKSTDSKSKETTLPQTQDILGTADSDA